MNNKRFRKLFRTSSSTIDYIITDLTINKINNRDTFFTNCVNHKLCDLEDEYNDRVNKILDYVICHCDFNHMPVKLIATLLNSISKITNAMTKGLVSLFGK